MLKTKLAGFARTSPYQNSNGPAPLARGKVQSEACRSPQPPKPRGVGGNPTDQRAQIRKLIVERYTHVALVALPHYDSHNCLSQLSQGWPEHQFLAHTH